MGILGAGINFSIGRPGVAGWGVQKLDTTYWAAHVDAQTPTWTGVYWEAGIGGKGGGYVRLKIPTSMSWHNSYRPDEIQLTWSTNSMRIYLYDSANNLIVSQTSQTSDGVPQTYTINWQGNDLRSSDSTYALELYTAGGAFNCTDIRFSS